MNNFIDNLIVDKEKKGSYLLGIQDNNQIKDIIIETPIVRTPFGIEDYNNKQIINIEFSNKDHDNDVFNFYNTVKSYEKAILDTVVVDDYNLDNLDYVTSIRQSGKFDPMIRVNLTNNSEIPLNGCPKNTKLKAQIRLKKIWVWKERWGLYWDVLSILDESE